MKSKKKIRIPAHSFGAAITEAFKTYAPTLDKALSNLPESTNLALSPFLKSTATTGSEATMQSISDIASGAATGFLAAGLPGAIVGASISLTGKRGKAAEATSFTGYDEGTLGTGLIGAFSNKKLREKREEIKQNAYSNRAAVQGTNYLQSEAYDDMVGMNTNTAANGGEVSSLVYVDDGELILTPDGSISKVPEKNRPTDSNLVSLPEGSRILSDKLKVPGRKETFAQLGEKMMAKKKSKYSDRFAENAAKLNEMNNNMIYDLLFAMLESVKQSKGIKPKTKKLVQAAEDGLQTGQTGYTGKRYSRKELEYAEMFGKFGYLAPDGGLVSMEDVAPQNLPKYRYYADPKGKFGINDRNEYFLIPDTMPANLKAEYDKALKMPDWSSYAAPSKPVQKTTTQERPVQAVLTATPTLSNETTQVYTQNEVAALKNLGDTIVDAVYNPNRKWGSGVQWGSGNNQWYHVPIKPNNTQPASDNEAAVSTSIPTRRRKATSTSTGLIDEGKPELPFTDINPLRAKHPELLIASNSEMAGLGDALTSHADKVTTLPKSNAYSKPKPENNKFNWDSALSGIASLAPIMSDLFTGRPETVDAVYNPYATSITNTMRRRRYDINPAIEDLNRNRATSNYNASQINTNTGANLAYRLQSAVNTDRAIAGLRSQESNANNQYLGDYANTMNSLGQQWVNATNMANEANAQNRATTRNIRRAGLSQLSQWAQNRELMRNQESRDNAMLAMFAPFLQSGYTADTIKQFNKWLRKGGNNVG